MAKRRGNNEGTIYKRKNGRWCAQVSLDGRRLTGYFETHKESRDWIQGMRQKIGDGLSFHGMKMDVAEFFERWLEYVESSLRPKTWRQYSQVAHQHILPELGAIRLEDLRPDHVQALYSKKLNAGKSRSTVRIIHAVLHRGLNQALRWGYMGSNPSDVVDKPKPKRKEMRILSAEQALQFLLTSQQSRFEALFNIAITTGLRQGELLGLRWSDLDWELSTLRVQRQLQRITGTGLGFTELKSLKARRQVNLGPSTLYKLRMHRRRQEVEAAFAGARWQENGLMFPSTIGTPMEPRNLVREYKKILREAKLPNLRFHDLRHTAASLMLQEGIHPKIVQERLGHSQISITLDTYSHVLPSLQEDAAQKIDELLTPIPIDLEVESCA